MGRASRCWRQFASSRRNSWRRAGNWTPASAVMPPIISPWPRRWRRGWTGRTKRGGWTGWTGKAPTCGRRCDGRVEAAPATQGGAAMGAWRRRPRHRAALRWARGGGARDTGLRLAGALWRFWFLRGHLREGRALLAEWTAPGDGPLPSTGWDARARATVLEGARTLAYRQGDYAEAATLLGESVALRRDACDTESLARTLTTLGAVARDSGEHGRAAVLYEERLSLLRAVGDTAGIASALNNLARLALYRGDLARATALYQESLALSHLQGDDRGVGLLLHNLGEVARLRGDLARAAVLCEESLDIFRRLHLGRRPRLHGAGRRGRGAGLCRQGDGVVRASPRPVRGSRRRVGDRDGARRPGRTRAAPW